MTYCTTVGSGVLTYTRPHQIRNYYRETNQHGSSGLICSGLVCWIYIRNIETSEVSQNDWVGTLYHTMRRHDIFFLCISIYKYYKQLFGWRAIPLFHFAVFGGVIYAAKYNLYQLVNTGIHKFRVRWVLYKRTHGPPKEVYIVLFHPKTDVHTPPAILGAAPGSLAHIGSIFSGNIHKPLIVNNLNKYTQL